MTTIQKRINTMNHVHNYNEHSTEHASKQALYDRMFHADNFAKYQPKGNETKFDLLVGYNVHIAITSHCLKRLASLGNMNAMELHNGINHTVSKEDLQQEVLLFFVENCDKWEIDETGKVTFDNDETLKALFTCISGYLRRFQTKHFKHLYIEIDNNIVDCNKVSQLADYVSIDELTQDVFLQGFLATLTELDRQWTEYRLQGLSNSKIATTLNVTYEKIRACEKRVRRLWAEYNE